MNVLSLFDGMSCGQIALERAGVKVNNYFASEIDKYAIQVTKHNYPNTKHIGDVTKVKGADLPKIDLLIGGSPCQGFSFAGKQLNFEDPRSKLFFEFVRLLEETKPKYFLLENVVMKKEYQYVISNILNTEPILINSSLVSAQNRKRLYWTNIETSQPDDTGIVLNDIITDEDHKEVSEDSIVNSWATQNYFQYDLTGKKHKSQDQRAYYVTGKHGTIPAHGGSSKVKAFTNDKRIICLTPIECERLQTVPDNYTYGVSNSQRYKMLGNGWTVDVIAHIFKGLLCEKLVKGVGR